MEFRMSGSLEFLTSGDVLFSGTTFPPVCISRILGFGSPRVLHLYISGPLEFCGIRGSGVLARLNRGVLENWNFVLRRSARIRRGLAIYMGSYIPSANVVLRRGDISAYCMSCRRVRASATAN